MFQLGIGGIARFSTPLKKAHTNVIAEALAKAIIRALSVFEGELYGDFFCYVGIRPALFTVSNRPPSLKLWRTFSRLR